MAQERRDDDPLVLQMTRRFFDDGMASYVMLLDQLFPVMGPGNRRMPIGSELIDDEEEWDLLEEVWRKWTRWKAGEVEEDSDILAFDRNDGQAQQRLAELRLQFSDGANGEVSI